jgi:hypothetical protein
MAPNVAVVDKEAQICYTCRNSRSAHWQAKMARRRLAIKRRHCQKFKSLTAPQKAKGFVVAFSHPL